MQDTHWRWTDAAPTTSNLRFTFNETLNTLEQRTRRPSFDRKNIAASLAQQCLTKGTGGPEARRIGPDRDDLQARQRPRS